MSDIFALFELLDRAGPGDTESLCWALDVAGTGPDATVLDAGCGTGADLATLLAAVPRGRVVAVDSAPAFVARVRARYPRVEAHVADMADPPGGPFDLIWSAGAVYNLGAARALSSWRAHLKPGGRVAFSDLCWRVPDPPEPARNFFAAEGVTPIGAADLAALVSQSGWRVLGARWLGAAGWAAYYDPLEERLATFSGDPQLTDGFRAEIALWREHAESYDYRLIVAEPA